MKRVMPHARDCTESSRRCYPEKRRRCQNELGVVAIVIEIPNSRLFTVNGYEKKVNGLKLFQRWRKEQLQIFWHHREIGVC